MAADRFDISVRPSVRGPWGFESLPLRHLSSTYTAPHFFEQVVNRARLGHFWLCLHFWDSRARWRPSRERTPDG